MKDERKKEVVQDSDVKDKAGTQPKKYFAGLPKKTKERRDAHFKKGAKMDDNNPDAYKPAPGDADAKTKPSKYTLKYKKMYGEDINEAFDKPYPVKLKPNHGKYNRNYYASVKLKDGTTLSITIEEEMGDGDFNLEFTRGGSQMVTGEGDAMRIFATVIEAVKQFFKMTKKETINFIRFTAVKSDDDLSQSQSGSREKLYERLLKRYLPQGFKMNVYRAQFSTSFEIVNPNYDWESTASSVNESFDKPYPFNNKEYKEPLEEALNAKALMYALKQHKGQTRSDGGPYIKHPVSVANFVKKYKKSKELDSLISAALLHDTIEDTDAKYEDIEKMFGGLVASLVKELTTDEVEKERVGKTEYLKKKMTGMSSWALVVKLADRLDNVQDIKNAKTPEWRNRYRKETLDILNQLEKGRKLSATHKKIIKAIRAKLDESDDVNEELEGLKKKAEKSGISYSILKKVYDRGVAAWRTGHRPGTTPQQWGYARVNSFITGGKTRTTADADLAKKIRKESLEKQKMDKEPKGNPVAKYMNKYNKSNVQTDKKKEQRKGYMKHKNTYTEILTFKKDLNQEQLDEGKLMDFITRLFSGKKVPTTNEKMMDLITQKMAQDKKFEDLVRNGTGPYGFKTGYRKKFIDYVVNNMDSSAAKEILGRKAAGEKYGPSDLPDEKKIAYNLNKLGNMMATVASGHARKLGADERYANMRKKDAKNASEYKIHDKILDTFTQPDLKKIASIKSYDELKNLKLSIPDDFPKNKSEFEKIIRMAKHRSQFQVGSKVKYYKKALQEFGVITKIDEPNKIAYVKNSFDDDIDKVDIKTLALR